MKLDVSDVAAIMGFAMLVAGLVMVWLPLALIAGGVLLIAGSRLPEAS